MHSFWNSSIWIEEKMKLLTRPDVGNSKGAAWTQEIKLNFLEGDMEEIFSFTKGMTFRFLNIFHNQRITKASKNFQNDTLTWYLLKFHISYKQLFYQNGNDRIREYWRLEGKSGSHLGQAYLHKAEQHISGCSGHFVSSTRFWTSPGIKI